MTGRGFTPGPWSPLTRNNNDAMVTFHGVVIGGTFVDIPTENDQADARLIAAAPDLLEALHEGRRAIGDHHAPTDCYATGPLTGDDLRDLAQCPACSFIAMYDAAIAKVTGAQS